jgi:hypothetical protein
VHPALATPEMQAIEPESWQVRQTDFDFLISQEARSIIEQEGIVLLSYQPLQKVWQDRWASTTEAVTFPLLSSTSDHP